MYTRDGMMNMIRCWCCGADILGWCLLLECRRYILIKSCCRWLSLKQTQHMSSTQQSMLSCDKIKLPKNHQHLSNSVCLLPQIQKCPSCMFICLLPVLSLHLSLPHRCVLTLSPPVILCLSAFRAAESGSVAANHPLSPRSCSTPAATIIFIISIAIMTNKIKWQCLGLKCFMKDLQGFGVQLLGLPSRLWCRFSIMYHKWCVAQCENCRFMYLVRISPQ